MEPARVAVAVAYSGGRDSTALLHATRRASASLGIDVVALHVHHGLSPNADAWLTHCQATCHRWARPDGGLRFVAERLAARPPKGASVEAWARKERYAALRRMALAQGASLVLLAHHRGDQAETLLLQALRGAGVAGLAGMPGRIEREGVTWARPWLAWPRSAIEAYVRRHRLACIEDDSNADARFARNRLRLEVWPPLAAAFPQAEAALAASASWAGEAASALAELAAEDMAGLVAGQSLDVARWSKLSPARRSNVLRAWLRQATGMAASATLASRLAVELPGCRSARWPAGEGELRCHRGLLAWHRASKAGSASTLETALAIPRAGTYCLPGWRGAIKATRTRDGGIALDGAVPFELRPRSGAEQFQAGPGRPPRSLKKQYQAAGIPAWQRRAPLVYAEGRLVFVPGLGVDARARAPAGEPQVLLEWLADTP